REFLRGDPAGADPAGAVPADPTAAEAAGAAPDSTAAEAVGAAPDPTAAEAAGTGPADPAPAAHPNAGAAGFGRPISEVLSAAQLEGIGRDSVFQAPPAPAEQQPAPQTPVDAAEPRSGEAEERPQSQRPVAPAAAPG